MLIHTVLSGLRCSGVTQVLAVSRRLLQLRNLLGQRGDVDIVHMLVREPRCAPPAAVRSVSYPHSSGCVYTDPLH